MLRPLNIMEIWLRQCIRGAFEGFYPTGSKQHSVSLIATLQEMLLQRESNAFLKEKKKSLFFSPPFSPSTCSDNLPLEAPKYLLLSVESRLVPGKRSFQVILEMKGRGNVCENAWTGKRREKGSRGERQKEREREEGWEKRKRGIRKREGEQEGMISYPNTNVIISKKQIGDQITAPPPRLPLTPSTNLIPHQIKRLLHLLRSLF